MPQLLESDFLTVNLDSILKTKSSSGQANAAAEGSIAATPRPANFDWKKELETRLTANKLAKPETRKSEYEIENQFFTEFFTNFFAGNQAAVKRALLIGSLLQKDIKILGFVADSNPVLSFLKVALDRLLVPGRLNAVTYRAIHNAVAKGLMADSEYQEENDYNILYCLDLYTKSAAEIEEYLTIQSRILSASNYPYNNTTKANNRRALFYIDAIKEQNVDLRKKAIKTAIKDNELPSALNSATKLNSIELASNFAGMPFSSDTGNKSTNNKKAADIQRIVQNLDTLAQQFAALQYLNLVTGAAEAQKALQHKAFNTVDPKELAVATPYVKQLMQNQRYTADKVTALVSAILGKL